MELRLQSLLIFLFSSFCLYASDARFYSINSLHGISVRETASVCKDENGFIWTSSRTGILRVTDKDYRIYQLPYVSTNIISVKLAYNNSQLYAYTNNGQLFLYDSIHDRFNLIIDLREPLERNFLNVHKVLVDNDGIVWIASSDGLFKYDKNILILIGEQVDAGALIPYKENYLILGTVDNIQLVNKNTLQTELLYAHTNQKRLHTSALFYDEQRECLWIGTFSDGLYLLDVTSGKANPIPVRNFPKQPILAFEENSASTLLVGIDGKGIWEINKEGDKVLNIYKEDVDNPSSLQGDGVYDIFCDENRRVWVSTHSGGLSFFDQESPVITHITHQINNPNSLSNNDINKVLEDSRGDIWFATNNGISRWKADTNKWDIYYQDKQDEAKVFLALCEDNDGNIWAGTYSSGVYVLEGKTGRELRHYSQDKPTSDFPNKFILDIYKDSDGDIWIGGIQGNVLCFLTKEKQFRTYTSQPVNHFQELSPGNILVICSYGLLALDKQSGNYTMLWNGSLIHDLLIIDEHLWMATYGDGLLKYNPGTKELIRFTTESGLVSNYVNSIIQVNRSLIVGTENGLCKFDLDYNTVHSYSSVFSLSNISYNSRSRCHLQNGDIVWGTNNGAILFNPDMLYEAPLTGQIFIQDISIAGRSVRENQELIKDIPVNKHTDISLKYNQNPLTLELISIGMGSAGCKYSWKMEGLDADWNKPSNHQIITYTNIPNGNFKLKMRMYNSALTQIIDERTLDVYVIPPYWKTAWFYLLITLLTGGIIYFSLRFYINHLKQIHTEDKIRFFTNTAHDIRTSLTLINAPVEELNKEKNLSEKGHYYLSLAIEQLSRLSFVATQLLDFQKIDIGKGQLFPVMTDIVNLINERTIIFATAAKRKNIELLFSTNQDAYITAVDKLKIEKVINNLLSNAIKFSYPDSKVEITFSGNKQEWILEVKDYGMGMTDKIRKKLFREFYRGDNAVNSAIVGSGIGLLLVKNYVSMHEGTIDVSSKENEGSVFRLRVPYKETHETTPDNISVEKIDTGLPTQIFSGQLPATDEENPAEKKLNLMFVEDNADLQDFMKYSLHEHYTITIAGNGKEAWDAIQKNTPDLIISDVMMPIMDGFELCKRVKSSFETSHIPFILLTALSEKTKQLEGLGLGADDYITKPFDMSILSERIKTILKNREIVREKALRSIGKTENEPLLPGNELNDKFVKKALKVVKENIANSEFGKEEFASMMNASSSLLYKKLKALTGQSPVDFIKTIRLNHAMELLQSQQYTVTEVSELCGFSSIGYFSTVFKKHFGKSPTDI